MTQTHVPIHDRVLRLLSACPDEPVAWTICRVSWAALIAVRLEGAPVIHYTADPDHPTLHGLPVTVSRDHQGITLHGRAKA